MRQCGWVAALLLAVGAGAFADDNGVPGDIPFERYALDNGLTVILAPDPESTAVTVNLWYDVGSRHERPGRSGFAHLFEHLMFQGSEHLEPGDHMQLVERAGGNMNASITQDRTNYFQTLPPDRVNLGLWLEAERMRGLRITEDNMRREVEVVKEERRLRVDNSPYGVSFLDAQFYLPYDADACFAYAHSVIGSMEDLDAAELEDVQHFFDLYYAPNNATLTVAGDFDTDTVRGLIEAYFGDIPAGERPPEPRCAAPFEHLPVSQELRDANATLPAFLASYGAVSADHPDSYALELLVSILATGESARLHQRLVRNERAALDVSIFPSLRKGPGVVIVFGMANQGVEPEHVGALIDEEIARVVRDGVTGEELERAKNRNRARMILSRQTVHGRAEALQWYNHFYGTPEALREVMARYDAVTVDDVRSVAARYLIPDNRATILTRPGTAEDQ